jgi:hypothetical protein
MTYHAKDGLDMRLAAAGLYPWQIEKLTTAAYRWAEVSPGPKVHAIRLALLPYTVHTGVSVGDTIWAICKEGKLLTVYLRRMSQGPPPCDMHTHADMEL